MRFNITTALTLAALIGGATTLPAIAEDGKKSEKAPPTIEAEVSADDILVKAGKQLFPEDFTSKVELVSKGADGAETTYRMMLYKLGAEKARADFLYPALEEGRRMLRVGDQIWMYVADLKRPVKMSPKQSLMGSDFNNGDLMRLSFEEDYTPSIKSQDDKNYVLELKAKSRSVAYDTVEYTIEKGTFNSVKQAFYTGSGRLVKTLEYKEYKTYDGYTRPSVFVMTNALATEQTSVMKYLEFKAGETLPAPQFRPDALARQ